MNSQPLDPGLSPRLWAETEVPYLRRLKPGDEKLLQRFFYSHTKQTVFLRYGYSVPTMSTNRAHRLLDLSEEQGVAFGLCAVVNRREELLAVGRYSAAPSHTAEIAIVVEEQHRRRGYATALLRELARTARSHEIHSFRAQVLRENFPMRRLLSRFQPSFDDDSVSRALDYQVSVSAVLEGDAAT